jgi:hypothetical protein
MAAATPLPTLTVSRAASALQFASMFGPPEKVPPRLVCS